MHDRLHNKRFNAIYSNPIMSTRSRDSLALYLIATLAVLVTLYADLDLGGMFYALLARF